MAARKKLHELGAHNDIRYRGPLSYQTFQVLGWSCIILSIAGACLIIWLYRKFFK